MFIEKKEESLEAWAQPGLFPPLDYSIANISVLFVASDTSLEFATFVGRLRLLNKRKWMASTT